MIWCQGGDKPLALGFAFQRGPSRHPAGIVDLHPNSVYAVPLAL